MNKDLQYSQEMFQKNSIIEMTSKGHPSRSAMCYIR